MKSSSLQKGGAVSEIADRVREIIAEQLLVDVEDVIDKAFLQDDLGADSLDAVELIMAFEDAFGVEIPDEVAEGLKTVKQAVDYVEELVQEKEGS